MKGKTLAIVYKAIPVEDLIEMPPKMHSRRVGKLADSVTEALNRMARDGWELVTSWKSANGTIFVFRKSGS